MRSVMLSAVSYCRAARAKASGAAGRRHQIEADIAQRAAAGAGGIRRIGAGDRHALVGLGQRGAEPLADAGAQRLARGVDGVGIDVAADLAGDVAFARRGERQRDEGRLELLVGEDGGERGEQRVVAARRAAGADGGDIVDQQLRRDRLQRLPAVERIAVVGGEEIEIGGGRDRS